MRPLLRCVVVSAIAVTGAAVPAAAQSLEEIIARNLAAKGGVERLQSTTTVRMSATVTLRQPDGPGTQTVRTSVIAKRPNLFRQERRVGGDVVMVGFDGTTAWTSGPLGTRALTGREAENLKADTQFDSIFLNYKEQGHRIELIGDETLDGRRVHHLKVIRKDGPVQHYYLDAETGLDVKMTTEGALPGGIPLPEMRFLDYRAVDGRTVPFKLQQRVEGRVAAESVFETIEFNVPIEDASFRMPSAR